MYGEVNKFTLVAYEKGNINNRTELNYQNNKNGKSHLSVIDMYTSGYMQYDFYSELLKQGVIKKEQKEFVIWYKEKDKIKQIPVIFYDSNIRKCSNYMHGIQYSENEEVKENKKFYNAAQALETEYKELCGKKFGEFISKVNDDSNSYNQLSMSEKQNYMNGNSFSARFVRMPYALSSIKGKVEDRILGISKDGGNTRVKGGKDYANNFGNIKNSILDSYRCFRDVYLYLKNNNNYEETHKDLDYKTIYEKQIEESINKEELKQIKEELIKTQKEDVIEQVKEEPKEIIYNFNHFERLLTNDDYALRSSFCDFAGTHKLLNKKAKQALWQIGQSFWFETDTDIYEKIGIISQFDSKHPGVLGKVVSDYYKFQAEADMQKKIHQ